jgi:hypothetical protein
MTGEISTGISVKHKPTYIWLELFDKSIDRIYLSMGEVKGHVYTDLCSIDTDGMLLSCLMVSTNIIELSGSNRVIIDGVDMI